MSDTRRTLQDGSLADLLAEQLNALANEWAPAGRHFVRVSHTDPDDDAESPGSADGDSSRPNDLDAGIRESDVRVDDVRALIARSFEYEAALWLWQCAAAPGSRTIH